MTNKTSSYLDYNDRTAYTNYQGNHSFGGSTVSGYTIGHTGLFAGLLDNKGQFVIAPTMFASGLGQSGLTEFNPSFGFAQGASGGIPISLGLKIEGNVIAGAATTQIYSGVGKGPWCPTTSGYLYGKNIYISRGASVPFVSISRTGSNWVEASGAYLNLLYYGTGVVGDLIYAEEGPSSGKLFRITGQGAGVSLTPGTTFYLDGYTGGALASGNRVSIWLNRTINDEGASYYYFDKKASAHPSYPNSTSFNNTTVWANAGIIQPLPKVDYVDSIGDPDYLIGYRVSGNLLTGLGAVYSGRLAAGDYVNYYEPSSSYVTAVIEAVAKSGAFDIFYVLSGYAMNTGQPASFTRSNHFYVDNAPLPGKQYTSVVYSGFRPFGNTNMWPTYRTTGDSKQVAKILGMDKIDPLDVHLDYSFNEYDSNVTSIGSRAHFHIGPLRYGNELILSGISGCRANLISPQSSSFSTIKSWDVPVTWLVATKSGAAQDGSYYDSSRGVFVLTYTAGVQFDQARTYTLDVDYVVNGQSIKRIIPVPTQPPV
jgi:hypothetical protein